MQILFPTFFKTCAEDALSRPKASSASLDERGRFEERSRFENAIDSKGGAGFDKHNWLEGWSRLRQTELTRRAESAPRSRADSKNGVGFDERSPLQRAGSARGARLVSGQCLLQRTSSMHWHVKTRWLEQEASVLRPRLLPLANAHDRNGVKAGTLKHRLEQNVRTQASGLFRLERELESISLSLHRTDEKV